MKIIWRFFKEACNFRHLLQLECSETKSETIKTPRRRLSNAESRILNSGAADSSLAKSGEAEEVMKNTAYQERLSYTLDSVDA